MRIEPRPPSVLPGLLWARVPRLFAAVALLYGAHDRRCSPLAAVIRSLVTEWVSQSNWPRFCVDINSMTLARRTGSTARVEALSGWREGDLFDERERVALECAEAMTDTGRRVSGELMDRLKPRFDDDAVIELTALIDFQNLSSKFNSALDVPAQGFCRMPRAERGGDGERT